MVTSDGCKAEKEYSNITHMITVMHSITYIELGVKPTSMNIQFIEHSLHLGIQKFVNHTNSVLHVSEMVITYIYIYYQL